MVPFFTPQCKFYLPFKLRAFFHHHTLGPEARWGGASHKHGLEKTKWEGHTLSHEAPQRSAVVGSSLREGSWVCEAELSWKIRQRIGVEDKGVCEPGCPPATPSTDTKEKLEGWGQGSKRDQNWAVPDKFC